MLFVLFLLYYLLPWIIFFNIVRGNGFSRLRLLIPVVHVSLLASIYKVSKLKQSVMTVGETLLILIPIIAGLLMMLPFKIQCSLFLLGILVGNAFVFLFMFRKIVTTFGFNPCSALINVMYFVFPFLFFSWVLFKVKRKLQNN